MTIPAAMFIAAAQEMCDEPSANDRIIAETIELEQARVRAPAGLTDYEAGYVLGLQTARVLLAGGIRGEDL